MDEFKAESLIIASWSTDYSYSRSLFTFSHIATHLPAISFFNIDDKLESFLEFNSFSRYNRSYTLMHLDGLD